MTASKRSADSRGADLIARLPGARLLLVVPHPDDESLALGGLIQHAVNRHARVTIVQVTTGDNNPWPQRWLERRLRIGPAERQRWGQRRAAEMLQALQCLGVDDSSLVRLGWPDLGVTARLRTMGTDSVGALAGMLRHAAPDIVVMPGLHDRHPDHATCHVVTRLAVQGLPRQPVCLTYHVHGPMRDAERPVVLPLDAAMREGKRHAILAHYTQVALARRRLLASVGETEILHELSLSAYGSDAASVPEAVRLPWHPFHAWHPWLRLTLAHPDGVHAWAWRDAPLSTDRHSVRLTLPAGVRRGPVFARLEMRCTSPWIFDHWGWVDLTAGASARQAGKRTG